MGKNTKKRSGEHFDEVFQPVDTGKEDMHQGESPTTDEKDAGGQVSSASKLKKKISLMPNAEVDLRESERAVGGDSGESGVTRAAAGFGGRADKGDTSRIPYRASANRPGSIDGKRNSENARTIDEVASEFSIPQVEEATALNESSNSDQVFNGRKIYFKERGKKNVKDNPQQLLFNASADLDISNFTLSTTGQVVGNPASQADYPTNDIEGQPIANPMHKGNYFLKEFSFEVKDGRITNPHFEEIKFEVPVNSITAEESNFNWKIDQNNVAKAMDKLQLKYGTETSDQWSPLGYAIENPYEHNMLLHDIEATTGAICATAVRAAVASLAFQRNIVHKDGLDPQASVVRMFLEGYAGSISDSTAITDATDIKTYVFNQNAYKKGSAAAIIPLFDSVSKYTKKSDFFLFPGGLGKTVTQGLSKYKPLRVKPQYLKALDKAHMYSTFDGTYSSTLPVYTTQTINLINPLSLNYFLKGWKHPEALREELRAEMSKGSGVTTDFMKEYKRHDDRTGVRAIYGYAYRDGDNRYKTRIIHPIVDGLMKWLLDHEGKIAEVYGEGEVHIPCSFNFMNPSMFQHMLCSAMADICLQRKDPMLNILSMAMKNADYIWEDLETLGDHDPLQSTQLKITDKDSPLEIGKLADDSKIRLLWGSNFHMIHSDGNNSVTYAMPWYVSDKAFQPNTSNGYTKRSGFKRDDDYAIMNIPSIRQGVNHAFVDVLQDMSESEIRLALDRFTDIPLFTNVEEASDECPFDVVVPITDVSMLSDSSNVSIASIKYDLITSGRVAINYKTDQNVLFGGVKPIRDISIFNIPKELGWIWETPPSLSPVIGSVSHEKDGDKKNHKLNITWSRSITSAAQNNSNMTGGTSRQLRSYRVESEPNPDGDIERGSAMRQVYRTGYADSNLASVNAEYTRFCGIVLDRSYQDGGTEDLNCFYVPSSTASSNKVKVEKFKTGAKYLWSLLQRFYIPDSPFYNCYDTPNSQEDDGYVRYDPLEVAFYFGLCGMLPTDYMTAVRSRLNISDQLDSDYTEDVYTEKSLFFQ